MALWTIKNRVLNQRRDGAAVEEFFHPTLHVPCSFILKKWRHLEKWSRLSDAIDRVLECAVNGNEHLHVTRRELLSGKHFLAQLQEQEV